MEFFGQVRVGLLMVRWATRHDTARTRHDWTRSTIRVDSSTHTRHTPYLVVSCQHDGTDNTPGRAQHDTIIFFTQIFSNQTANRGTFETKF
jgi:hypothetical protein